MSRKLNEYKNIPDPPTPPPTRLIRESDGPPLCNICGSSLHKMGFLWLKTDGCIQPKCKNYYARNKTTEGK